MTVKNQNELDKLLDDLIAHAEKEINRVYARRLKTILKEIQHMYEKYEKDGKLTLADMSKYNRLDKSMNTIIAEFLKAQTEAYALAQTTMETQFLENYFRSAYLFEFEAQQLLGFGQLSKETIQAAIKNPIDKLTLPALQKRNRAIIVDKIKIEIQQGLLAGESYSKMAQRIREAVNFDASKARAVARTESHRVQVEGRRKSAEQAAKHIQMKKMWDATLDTRTRPAHRHLDGTIKPLSGTFKSLSGGVGLQPGMMMNPKDDINCRCSLIYLVNERKPEVRRARLDNGKTAVVPYMNFEEWYKNRISD